MYIDCFQNTPLDKKVKETISGEVTCFRLIMRHKNNKYLLSDRVFVTTTLAKLEKLLDQPLEVQETSPFLLFIDLIQQ